MHSAVLYWVILGIVAAGTAVGLFFANDSFYQEFLTYTNVDRSPSIEQLKQAKLVIDFGGGKKRVFGGIVVEGMTVHDALLASQQAGNLSFASDPKSGISAIEGSRNTAKRRWQLYINGKIETTSPVSRTIKPGDEILLRYEPR